MGNNKIGFIGSGKMAGAIIKGLVKTGFTKSENITATQVEVSGVEEKSKELGVKIILDNKELVKWADVVFIATKPNQVLGVLEEIKPFIDSSKLVVSIAAGVTIKKLEDNLPEKTRVIRVMPNTPALVGEGCTALSPNANVSEEETELALKIARSFGKASIVPERLMDAVVAASGSSPAFVFMFIEALADSVVEAGMPRSQAYMFAAQTVLGSAKLMLETGRHPADLKDMVCSPGGTTIEGVRVLEEKGFRAAVIDAAKAVAEKSAKL